MVRGVPGRCFIIEQRLAVCAAVIRLIARRKSLSVNHFGELLTACMRFLKGNVRPGKVPETRKQLENRRGHRLEKDLY
jgi:hypothetical protein